MYPWGRIPAGGKGVGVAPRFWHDESPALAGLVIERLLSLPQGAAPTAPALADHCGALLARRDAVPVAFEDSLGSPSNDGDGIGTGLKLARKLLLELLNECHECSCIG